MRCFDCGKQTDKLYDFVDGRRTIKLCQMCKAEREWRENKNIILPPPQKINPWQKIINALSNAIKKLF